MKLVLPAALLLCLANPADAQTRPQAPAVQGKAAPERSMPIVAPRKERPLLIEALLLRDTRIALEIRKLQLVDEAKRK